MTQNPVHALDNELHKAVTLRELLAGENWSEADILSALETETDLSEALSDLDAAVMEDEIQQAGLKSKIDQLTARYRRIDKRRLSMRHIIMKAMIWAGWRKFVGTCGTLSLTRVPPGVVIFEVEAIPEDYWIEQEPKLDKKLVVAVLKDGQPVPGVGLDNGSETLKIRRS